MANSEPKRRRGRRFWRTRLTPFELTLMLLVIGGGVVLTIVLLLYIAQPSGG